MTGTLASCRSPLKVFPMRSLFTLLLLVGILHAADVKYPAMPKASSSLGAVACDGYAYIYGGNSGKTHSYNNQTVLGTFHRLKLDGGTAWEELPGGPIAQGVNLAANAGKIYRVGGMQPLNAPGEPADTISLDSASVYDPSTKKWSDLPKLPKGRSSHDVVVVGDTLYVVAGWCMNGKDGSSEWADTAYSLDLKAAKPEWKSVKQPFQRRALTVTALGSKLYVLGGLDVDAKPHNRVDVLDTATGKWSQGPDLPGGKVGFSPAATTLNDQVLVNTVEGPLYRLNKTGDAWEKVGESVSRRIVHRIVPHGNAVLMLGGSTRGDWDMATVERVEVAAK